VALAVQASIDQKPSDELIATIMDTYSADKGTLQLHEFRALLTGGLLHKVHVGRCWVALSLAEAETVRRILKIRKKKNPLSLINNATAEVALRYSIMCAPGRIVFDASWRWQRAGTGATPYEAAVAHSLLM
jgi:hypothetical protein